MRILLLGDYSNVHNTLAEGLKALGHDCVVASDGDHWKDYPRDIDLKREFGLKGSISYVWRLIKAMLSFRGYDIVQLINPVFLDLKAEKIAPFYRYLRKHNRKVVLGAFGMDYYWVDVNTNIRPLRYSDFNIGDMVRMDPPAVEFRNEYADTPKGELCRQVAADCDWIVAGLQEYWATYDAVPELKGKMSFIPFPIKMPENESSLRHQGKVKISDEDLPLRQESKVKIFAGLSKGRVAYKGLDIMLQAARDVEQKYPDKVEINVADSVPFAEYQKMISSSDAILDQLYSYTPAMNSLLCMSKGIINIGGGEPENYEILGEEELRPIINVQPTYDSCFHEIEQLVLHPERIPELKRQSVEYVRKHHDYIKVARQYEELYKKLLS